MNLPNLNLSQSALIDNGREKKVVEGFSLKHDAAIVAEHWPANTFRFVTQRIQLQAELYVVLHDRRNFSRHAGTSISNPSKSEAGNMWAYLAEGTVTLPTISLAAHTIEASNKAIFES